jgi:subtilisin family serine protease
VDVNVRAAWPYSTGEGVIVAVADNGVEMNHVELTNSVTGAPHYNFAEQTTNGLPVNRLGNGCAWHGSGRIDRRGKKYRPYGRGGTRGEARELGHLWDEHAPEQAMIA